MKMNLAKKLKIFIFELMGFTYLAEWERDRISETDKISYDNLTRDLFCDVCDKKIVNGYFNQVKHRILDSICEDCWNLDTNDTSKNNKNMRYKIKWHM